MTLDPAVVFTAIVALLAGVLGGLVVAAGLHRRSPHVAPIIVRNPQGWLRRVLEAYDAANEDDIAEPVLLWLQGEGKAHLP